MCIFFFSYGLKHFFPILSKNIENILLTIQTTLFHVKPYWIFGLKDYYTIITKGPEEGARLQVRRDKGRTQDLEKGGSGREAPRKFVRSLCETASLPPPLVSVPTVL